MASPAGVQLRRWLVLFLLVLVGLNLAAVAASFDVSRALRKLAQEDDTLVPLAVSAQLEVAAAESELFQYFAKISDSTEGALTHIDSLRKTVEGLRARHPSQRVNDQILKILETSAELKKLVELLPEPSLRSRYRWRLRQDSATAATLGKDLEGLTLGLTQAAAGEIRVRVASATQDAQRPVWTGSAAILACVGAFALLPGWWRRFQELILST